MWVIVAEYDFGETGDHWVSNVLGVFPSCDAALNYLAGMRRQEDHHYTVHEVERVGGEGVK